MKRIAVTSLLAVLFIAVQTTAQEPGASAPGVSLDQDYLDLLKKRVEVTRIKFKEADAAYKAGHPSGTALWQAESRIALATAEAGLYRQTGERENLLAALERKREATEDTVHIAKAGYQAGTGPYSLPAEAELSLVEAEYELKKAKTPPPALARQFLFQGKTFEQWVELLETELDPKVRAEAFRALALFGANGRGKEATEVVFAQVQAYDYFVYDDSPAGQMKEAAIDTLAPIAMSNSFRTFGPGKPAIPLKDSFPILMRNFKDGDVYQQSLARMVLARPNLPELKEYLPVLYETAMNWEVTDAEDDRLSILLSTLGRLDLKGEYVMSYLRNAVKTGNAEHFNATFAKLFSIISMLEGDARTLITNFGFHPFLFKQESDWHGGMGAGGNSLIGSKLDLTLFGEKLLKFLQDEGLESDNESIRETSQKVVDALKSIEDIPQ